MNENNEKDNEKEVNPGYTDLSEKSEDSSVPLNFDYYKKTDYSSVMRTIVIAGVSVLAIVCAAAAIRTVDKRKSADIQLTTEPFNKNAYPDSPYADDLTVTEKSYTDDGLSYTLYEHHARITEYKDIFIPIDFTIPDQIKGLPVTEIDYYVFSYCKLKSLTVTNPECIFFDGDDDLSPVAVDTEIIAPEGSDAQRVAEKYGNKFTAK
ncbi:MAG: hypothetical protein WBK46_17655 [Ruminococcus flavefaciens]